MGATSRVRTAAASALAGAALAAALLTAALVTGCHELELSQLRCSARGRCPDGYACAADGYCHRGPSGAAVRPAGAKTQGEACGAGAECSSGFCADGVCCNAACGDACQACNLPDNVGTCVPVSRGTAPAHGTCPREATATCGTNGMCDGAGHCERYDQTTVCGQPACDPGSNTLVPERRCDGNGTCIAAGPGLSCAPFKCNAARTGCADRCSDLGECVLPNLCVGGSCGKIGNGLACRDGAQCQSGFCVDGVCCNAPCGDQCMACDVSGALGTCTQVAGGSPHGGRPVCAGGGSICGGQCTAASGTACTYPAAEATCRSASCTNTSTNAVQTSAASCDGRGACGAGTSSACGVYMCGATGACATSCVGDFDCAAGYTCQGGACVPRGMAAAPCTTTAQCAGGLTCKDGVCCESACADACRSCVVPGHEGECTVVASADDPDSCAAESRTCDAAGACKLKPSQTCMGNMDCAGGPCTVYYPDADGDGFGDMMATKMNGRAKGLCGAAPAGFVTSHDDCCDAMKQAHPGQTEWFTAPNVCGSFDYDCDGAETPQWMAGGACTATEPTAMAPGPKDDGKDDGKGGGKGQGSGGSGAPLPAAPAACTAGFVADTACGVSGSYQPCDQSGACPAPAAQPQSCR